jgi:hypothetical protein
VTPWFGVIQLTTVSHLTVVDSTAPPTTQSAWVVVAPWRLLGVLTVLLVFGLTLRWQLSLRGIFPSTGALNLLEGFGDQIT